MKNQIAIEQDSKALTAAHTFY